MAEYTTLAVKAIDPVGKEQEYYIHRDGDLPVVLGTGRNAVVFLARTAEDQRASAVEYRAIKFLKNDIDREYADESARRFFDEAEKTRGFGRLVGSFVRYESWGFIGALDRDWHIYYGKDADRVKNEGEEYATLQKYYFLRGPFYVVELCQGTIQDLLDKDIHWADLNAYRHIGPYQRALRSQTEAVAADVGEVGDRYMRTDVQMSGMSGYDVLNAFKDEPAANSVRNFAVLELFSKIAWTVWQLHAEDSSGGLAHRDLKPGNVFLQHRADSKGFDHVSVKLSDLGYVAQTALLQSGDHSLRQTFRNPGALTPGSQFFRAPEQAELPIEVRVDVDERDPTVVFIRSSKVGDIQHGDWLSIGDYFTSQRKRSIEYTDLYDPSLFKIVAVEIQLGCHAARMFQTSYKLKLEREVQLDMVRDLQAHVIRSTGFHTDGFSLGAMLYDLASGGKNPELFYTYCLMGFTSRFARLFETAQYGVGDIVDILSPAGPTIGNGAVSSESLRLKEKWQIVRHLVRSQTIDATIEAMLESSLRGADVKKDITEELRNYRFRHFHLVNDLLCDHRGVPIPRGILAVITKCMLRDIEGAYYASSRETGFVSVDNQQASQKIYQDVELLLGQPAYQLPRSFPASLQTNLLFKLRVLASPPESLLP